MNFANPPTPDPVSDYYRVESAPLIKAIHFWGINPRADNGGAAAGEPSPYLLQNNTKKKKISILFGKGVFGPPHRKKRASAAAMIRLKEDMADGGCSAVVHRRKYHLLSKRGTFQQPFQLAMFVL